MSADLTHLNPWADMPFEVTEHYIDASAPAANWSVAEYAHHITERHHLDLTVPQYDLLCDYVNRVVGDVGDFCCYGWEDVTREQVMAFWRDMLDQMRSVGTCAVDGTNAYGMYLIEQYELHERFAGGEAR